LPIGLGGGPGVAGETDVDHAEPAVRGGTTGSGRGRKGSDRPVSRRDVRRALRGGAAGIHEAADEYSLVKGSWERQSSITTCELGWRLQVGQMPLQQLSPVQRRRFMSLVNRRRLLHGMAYGLLRTQAVASPTVRLGRSV